MTPLEIQSRLDLWPGLSGTRAELINLSENHTFRLDLPDGTRRILRVHRPGYHSRAAIESELGWLSALRADTQLPVVEALPGRDGRLVQDFASTDNAAIFAVLFVFEEGVEPQETDGLAALFEVLGRSAATCHRHVEKWHPHDGFVRQSWTTDAILDPNGIWGDWRQAPNVSGETRDILNQLDESLRDRFASYGRSTDRFGLIHADMRLANLLIHKGGVRVIDFDDCGFGWFAYDFAAAVSFFEDSPEVPVLKEHWLRGYRSVRAFSADDERMLEPAILLRRMALLAWIGSHAETELAQSQTADFAPRTAALAAKFLNADG